MSGRKEWWFAAVVISIAAFACAGTLNVPIKEYDVPTPHARPHDPAVAPDGALWVTYGIAITRNGEVWYSESGVHPNTLVKFDPRTESFSAEPIPSGGGVVRNMVATQNGRLYLACSGVDKVAVVTLGG